MTEQSDKRRLDRTRTILAAHAVLGRGLADVQCQVKDISDTGARLTVGDGAILPDRFQLRIPKRHMANNVEVRWREGALVGVEFVEERRTAERRDSTDRIKALETENAILRRRVAELSDRLYAYGASDS